MSNLGNYTNTYSQELKSKGVDQSIIYLLSSTNWSDYNKYVKFANINLSMPLNHAPVISNNREVSNTLFDYFSPGKDDITPMVLRSKEESAPSHIFSTY
jgi:hypothetical protein